MSKAANEWLLKNSFVTDLGEHVIHVTTFLKFIDEHFPDEPATEKSQAMHGAQQPSSAFGRVRDEEIKPGEVSYNWGTKYRC